MSFECYVEFATLHDDCYNFYTIYSHFVHFHCFVLLSINLIVKVDYIVSFNFRSNKFKHQLSMLLYDCEYSSIVDCLDFLKQK